MFEKRSSHTSKIKTGLNWLILHLIWTSTLKVSEKKVSGDVFFLAFPKIIGLIMNVNTECCRRELSLPKIRCFTVVDVRYKHFIVITRKAWRIRISKIFTRLIGKCCQWNWHLFCYGQKVFPSDNKTQEKYYSAT